MTVARRPAPGRSGGPVLTFLRSRPLSALLLGAVLVATQVGCGGDDKSDSDQVEAVAHSWAGAVHDKNWDGVCRDFSQAAHMQIRQIAAQLEVTSCAAVMQTAFTRPGNPLQNISSDKLKVTNIKVNGSHATADVLPSADRDPTTYFVKEKGAWKIDADPQPAAATTGPTGATGPTGTGTTTTPGSG